MNIKLLTKYHVKFLSLRGGYTGSYECTLVNMPHCWKSHITAHLFMLVHRTKIFLQYIIFASSEGSEKESSLHSLIALENRFKSPGAGSHKSLKEDMK